VRRVDARDVAQLASAHRCSIGSQQSSERRYPTRTDQTVIAHVTEALGRPRTRSVSAARPAPEAPPNASDAYLKRTYKHRKAA
jgi:hypothetical protein